MQHDIWRAPWITNVEMVSPNLFMRAVQTVITPSHSRTRDTFRDPENDSHWACAFLWIYLGALLSLCKPCPRSQAFSAALLAPWLWPGTGVCVASVWTRQMGEMNCVRNKCSQHCWTHSLPWLPAYLPTLAPSSELHLFLINSRNHSSQCSAEHLMCLTSSSPPPLELLLHGSCIFHFIPAQFATVFFSLVAPLLSLLEERVPRHHS